MKRDFSALKFGFNRHDVVTALVRREVLRVAEPILTV